MSVGMEGLIELLSSHPYLLLFPLVLVEGPVATVCAGFLVSVGLMDWPLALALVVVADLTADSFYYALGRSGSHPAMRGVLERLGLSAGRLGRLRLVLVRHGVKAIVWAKVADLFAVPVFAAAGLVRMDYRTLILHDLAVTLPKSAALMALGFFFGAQIEPYLGFWSGLVVLLSLTIVAGLAMNALRKLTLKEDSVEGLHR